MAQMAWNALLCQTRRMKRNKRIGEGLKVDGDQDRGVGTLRVAAFFLFEPFDVFKKNNLLTNLSSKFDAH